MLNFDTPIHTIITVVFIWFLISLSLGALWVCACELYDHHMENRTPKQYLWITEEPEPYTSSTE